MARPPPRGLPSAAPSSSAIASPPVTPVQAAHVQAIDERIPFVLAAHGRTPMHSITTYPDVHLYALDGALFLVAGRRVARLGPKGLSPNAAIEKAIPRDFEVNGMFGVWPKSSFVEIHPRANAPEPPGALLRMSERGAARLHSLSPEESYEGLWYGGQGRIGAVFYRYVYGSIATGIAPLDGSKGPVPDLARIERGQPRIALYEMASFPSGHLFLFGVDRLDEHTLPSSIERWEPGAIHGTFEHLPMPPGAKNHIERFAMGAGSPSNVWIAGIAPGAAPKIPDQPYLARWDGARWSLVEMPAPSFDLHGASGAAATADGDLWIGWTGGDEQAEIMHRRPDGSWSRAALPAPPPALPSGPYQLLDLVEHEGELWIVTSSKADPARFAVYRTRPSEGALTLELNATKQ